MLVDTDNDEPAAFKVKQIFPDFSVIADAAELEPLGQLFKGKVTGQLKKTCKFYFDSSIAAGLQQQIWDAQYKNASGADAVNFPCVELAVDGAYRQGLDYILSLSGDGIILNGRPTADAGRHCKPIRRSTHFAAGKP